MSAREGYAASAGLPPSVPRSCFGGGLTVVPPLYQEMASRCSYLVANSLDAPTMARLCFAIRFPRAQRFCTEGGVFLYFAFLRGAS
jgi:hypothetical protein